jgi:hypothetical protein
MNADDSATDAALVMYSTKYKEYSILDTANNHLIGSDSKALVANATVGYPTWYPSYFFAGLNGSDKFERNSRGQPAVKR